MTTTQKRAIERATAANIVRVRTPEREAEYRAWWEKNRAKLTTPDARLELELKLSTMLAATFREMREALAPTLDAAERWNRLVATTRMAKCRCGAMEPSSERTRLYDFQDRSVPAVSCGRKVCGNCGYFEEVHGKATGVFTRVCESFVQGGPSEFDSYWCGCGNND